MASSLADRGKAAEKEVKLFLERFNNERAAFDFERLPDARSSGGRVAAQAADFAFFTPGMHGLIEVKETQHEFRLSRSKITQLPKMSKRRLAGGECIVLIFHSMLPGWRVVPLYYLLETEGASWDLSQFPLYETAEQALRTFDIFRRRA